MVYQVECRPLGVREVSGKWRVAMVITASVPAVWGTPEGHSGWVS